VREFIAQFRGMSATEQQKTVLDELGVSHLTLAKFFGSATEVDHERMQKLLRLLQQHTRQVRPELLGVIGKEHLRQMMTDAGGKPEAFEYTISVNFMDGRPYVVEIAICPLAIWVDGKGTGPRQLITGVNFSATLQNPFNNFRHLEGMSDILAELYAGPGKPVIVCVHLACAYIEYLDRGKGNISLD
jgi:hypothetical protein